MPNPEEIEWDESTTKPVNPDDVEWDESTTVDLVPFDGASASASGSPTVEPTLEDTLRGATTAVLQGPALNWADEAAGLQAAQRAALSAFPSIGKDGSVVPATPRSERVDPDWAYQQGRDQFRGLEAGFRQQNPAAAFALTVGSGMGLGSPIQTSGGGLARYLPNIVEGAISGAGGADELEDVGRGGVFGAALGAAGRYVGEAAGDLAGAVAQRASTKVAAAEKRAQDLAAEKVAKEIASAKGKLGSTTQEANRFVENLIRLESAGALNQSQVAQLASLRQSGILPALEQKLADAMLDEVPGAAGRVDIARAAYEGLANRANDATDEAAQQILSGSEAKRQVGERVKRYLPTIVGSLKGAAAGGVTGAVLGNSPTEMLVGALAGAGIRPAVRATQRMMSHPAVQSAVNRPIQSGAAGFASAANSAVGAGLPQAATTFATGQSVADTSEGDFVAYVAQTNPEALGQYADTLQRAAAQGNLPLVHWRLQQTDPNYRLMLESARKGVEQ